MDVLIVCRTPSAVLICRILLKDPIIGLAVDPGRPELLFAYTCSSFAIIRIDKVVGEY